MIGPYQLDRAIGIEIAAKRLSQEVLDFDSKKIVVEEGDG